MNSPISDIYNRDDAAAEAGRRFRAALDRGEAEPHDPDRAVGWRRVYVPQGDEVATYVARDGREIAVGYVHGLVAVEVYSPEE